MVLLLFFGLTTSRIHALEIQSSVIEPIIERYEIISHGSILLDKENAKAKIKIYITAETTSKFKNGTLKLYKYANNSWTTVRKWSNLSSATSTFLFNDNSVSVQSGYTYKAKLTITAYNSSTNEPITLSVTKAL